MAEASSKYSPQDLKAARASQVAYAMQLLANHPGDEGVKATVNEILSTDPAEVLDMAERQKNPIVF